MGARLDNTYNNNTKHKYNTVPFCDFNKHFVSANHLERNYFVIAIRMIMIIIIGL